MKSAVHRDQVALDHFGIIDRDLRLYIVVGPNHPPNGFVAYLKYVPSTEPSLWRSRAGVYYRRILRFYSVRNAWSASLSMPTSIDPTTMSRVPIVPHDRVWMIIDPRNRAQELIQHCMDELECLAADLVSELALRYGLPQRCIGISGSIMFGIHNLERSDIDIVIYGEKCVERVIQGLKEAPILAEISDTRLSRIVENAARIHNLSLDVARALYSIPRRGLYRGREVTLVYTYDKPLALEGGVRSQRCVRAVLAKEPGDIYTIMYPAHFNAELVKIGDSCVGTEIEVLAFESAYSIPMYFGGIFEVSALLQELASDKLRLIIGVRECDNYLRWIKRS